MKDVIYRQVQYGRQFRINWCAFCNVMSITRLFVIDISNSIKWLSEVYSIDTKVELSQRETMPHKSCLGRTHRTHDINVRYLLQGGKL